MWKYVVACALLAAGCGGSGGSISSDRAATSLSTTVPDTPPTTAARTVATHSTSAPQECDGSTTFAHPPVDLDGVELIVPLGLMFDSHVTPVDHQYFQNFAEPDRWIDVYSPGQGRVTQIQHMNQPIAEDTSRVVDDYRVVIEHTCSISSIFIHIGQLSPRLAAVAPEPGGFVSIDLAVEANESIGAYQGNVDYNVVDLDFTTTGLLVADHYRAEPWKIHTPDPFAYFSDDLRDQMERLSIRNGQPKGGVFAHDLDGRLVGNWFRQGTNGYAGVDRDRYWSTHLAVAYNHLDPNHVMVSIGDFDGRSRQFGVVGNAPDPAEIAVGAELVVYELVDFDFWVGLDRWDRVSHSADIEVHNTDQIHGVALLQLIDDRTLRFEVFPGATTAEVDGFTGAALVYER